MLFPSKPIICESLFTRGKHSRQLPLFPGLDITSVAQLYNKIDLKKKKPERQCIMLPPKPLLKVKASKSRVASY